MVEKTLRYPGHAERVRVLRDSGFFSRKELQAASGRVRPRDVSEALLFEAWRFDDREPDLTAMRIEVEGVRNGRAVRHTYSLLDRYDERTDTSSMARTTGYTCTAMVRLVADALWTEPGVVPPETVGANGTCFDAVLRHLAERNVRLHAEVEEL